MRTQGLFHEVLIAPALEGADRLLVVSGYASAQLCERHLNALRALGCSVEMTVVVGMAGEAGLAIDAHRAWQKLEREQRSLTVLYTPRGTGDHSKTYVWSQQGVPTVAWTGSANYSQSGFAFVARQRTETLTPVDAGDALAVTRATVDSAISTSEAEVSNLVDFYEVQVAEVRVPVEVGPPSIETAEASVNLPLVQVRTGEVHNAGAGLNWGHRGARRRSEAYIPVPKEVQRSGFFPEVGVPFEVETDDGSRFTMVRAQQNGKALHSADDNSIIGRYFRQKLGLEPDAFVTTDDLRRFGATVVRFTAVGNGRYRLEFPPSS